VEGGEETAREVASVVPPGWTGADLRAALGAAVLTAVKEAAEKEGVGRGSRNHPGKWIPFEKGASRSF